VREADVPVARAPNRAIAEMWAELLGGEGIICRIVPINPGASIYVPHEEDVELRVPAIDAARALDLLPHEARQAVEEPEDDVPADPVENRLRWIFALAVIGLILIVVALAARCSPAAGYL
jgi:hypothetical protein